MDFKAYMALTREEVQDRLSAVKADFPEDDGTIIAADDDDMVTIVTAYVRAQQDEADAKLRKERAQLGIFERMGAAARMKSGTLTVTYQTKERKEYVVKASRFRSVTVKRGANKLPDHA